MITPNGTSENAIQGEVELDINLEDIFGNKLTFKKMRFLLANLGGSQKMAATTGHSMEVSVICMLDIRIKEQ